MNNLYLSKLKNSVGKRLKFKTFCFVGNNFDKVEDVFYATLLYVNDDCVNEYYYTKIRPIINAKFLS